MPYLTCLICGALSKKSRCPQHDTRDARGYGEAHRRLRKDSIDNHPWCELCGHLADPETGRCGDMQCAKCPLTLHHVVRLRGGRAKVHGQSYKVLCGPCNRAEG